VKLACGVCAIKPLTRQFAIEYSALFDATLPALQRLKLPVPLGGTSNHFPRKVLEDAGRWDPFNVTEDADLGIRLARRGFRVEILESTTWEEAPADFQAWRNQRTRWLKGWMQTYLVHMRRPLQTARELGAVRFLGLQILMGGLILSALVHPWFYAAAAWHVLAGASAPFDRALLSNPIALLGLSNLVLGYVTGIALGAVAVAARKRHDLIRSTLTMPVYWLLISLAAYRALFQLIREPYRWEKTPHRPRTAFTAAGT
jgi:glycosyltransferase XagB